MDKLKLSQLKIKEWRENPCSFVEEVFGVTPDKWQAEVLKVFPSHNPEHMRISMQACAGPGKSAVLAWLGWNFLACYGKKGEHPKGAAVSVTADNLRDNLWTELSKWQQHSEYLKQKFKWTKTRIFSVDHPETWFLSARSFPRTADTETLGKTLSGIHSEYVLFLIDESGDIPVQVGKAAEQAMGNHGFSKILQAGNPISLDGMLYAASISDDWHIVRITGDPEDELRSPRIDIEWARSQIKKYGRTDPWVASYILGKFPESSLNTLLSLHEVEQALGKHLTVDQYEYSQKRLGIDVARFGMDSTIIFPRQGLASFKYTEMRGARSNEIASRVALAKSRWDSELEYVDGTGGYGSGVVDSLIQTGYSPQEINFASKADSSKYYNKRAEMWFRMAEWIKRGGAIPVCPTLKKELLAPQYTFKQGKFLLESKDQIKDRLGFSTDRADALALTFADVEMPGKTNPRNMFNKKNYKSDYNPLGGDR